MDKECIELLILFTINYLILFSLSTSPYLSHIIIFLFLFSHPCHFELWTAFPSVIIIIVILINLLVVLITFHMLYIILIFPYCHLNSRLKFWFLLILIQNEKPLILKRHFRVISLWLSLIYQTSICYNVYCVLFTISLLLHSRITILYSSYLIIYIPRRIFQVQTEAFQFYMTVLWELLIWALIYQISSLLIILSRCFAKAKFRSTFALFVFKMP